MRSAFFRLLLTGATVATPIALAAFAGSAACTIGGDSPDGSADAAATCGSTTCGSTQFCLYRACSQKDLCVVETTCPDGTTPSVCDGQPGCLTPASSCQPTLQGCRDIPATCGGDVNCACDNVCGSASACQSVSDRTATCNGT